jgi:hypothetical protein
MLSVGFLGFSRQTLENSSLKQVMAALLTSFQFIFHNHSMINDTQYGPVPSGPKYKAVISSINYFYFVNTLNETHTAITLKAHFKLLVKIFKHPLRSATWYAIQYKCDVFLQSLYVITTNLSHLKSQQVCI